MSVQALRGRMPLLVFILLAIVCLALLGFACACLGDHPLQAIERALGAIPSLPPLTAVWSPITVGLLALLGSSSTRRRIEAPSLAALQRFLF